jgi:hypothetical protein
MNETALKIIQDFRENNDSVVVHAILPDGKVRVVMISDEYAKSNPEIVRTVINLTSQYKENYDKPNSTS